MSKFCIKIILRLARYGLSLDIAMKKTVALLRVSTDAQEERHSIEAQRIDIAEKFVPRGFTIVKEFIEVESAGKADRSTLDAAIDYCRRHHAVLLVADLDRLSRRLLIIATLLESPIHFRVAAYPDTDPKENPELFHMLGLVAEVQLRRLRKATKAGLAVAKAKGVILGQYGKVLAEKNSQAADEFALKMAPSIARLRDQGVTTCRKIAKALNRMRVPSFRPGCRWHAMTVHALLKRIEKLKANLSDEKQGNTITSLQMTGP